MSAAYFFASSEAMLIFSLSTLVPEPYSDAHNDFVHENGIVHFQVGIEPNKNPFVTTPQCVMTAALRIVLDPSNYPLLIHCNKGKVRRRDMSARYSQNQGRLTLVSTVPDVSWAVSARLSAGSWPPSSPNITVTPIQRRGSSTNASLNSLMSDQCCGWQESTTCCHPANLSTILPSSPRLPPPACEAEETCLLLLSVHHMDPFIASLVC